METVKSKFAIRNSKSEILHRQMDKPKAQGNNHTSNNIRDQLKELGYLGGPVQQFLAGKISPSTSLLKTNLLVGAKVGLMGGCAVGVLVAIGMIILNPVLLASVKDVALLTSYLVLIYSVMASVLAVVNSALLSMAFKVLKSSVTEGKLVAGAVGTLSAAAIFAYLIFWWRAQDAMGFSAVPTLVILILGVVLAISFLIGRLFTFASLIVLWRVGRVKDIDKVTQRRGALALASSAIIAIFFFSFLWFTERTERHHDDWRENADLSMRPEERLVLIGIDGLSRRALDLLIEENKVPNLASLTNKGASGPLRSQIIERGSKRKRLPPLVWTTIATGMSPQRHGVTGFDSLKIKGIDTHISFSRKDVGFYQVVNDVFPFFKLTDSIPLSGLDREEKTFWEILSEANRSVGVINWWLTWPAEEVNGFLISDRTYPILQISSRKVGASDTSTHHSPLTARRSLGPTSLEETSSNWHFRYETSPPEILEDLKERFEEVQIADLFPLDLQDQAKQNSRLYEAIKTTLSLDSFYVRCVLDLDKEFHPDFLAVYLQGIDALQNMLDELPDSPSALVHLKLRAKAIESHCAYLDRAIGEIINNLGKDCTVMVVIDPGMTAVEPGMNTKRPEGALIMSGPRIRQVSLSNASVFDIAPTILALSGLPVSEEMEGKVLTTALEKTFLERFPVRAIPSFGKKETVAIAVDASADERMYRHLKMLGYVE